MDDREIRPAVFRTFQRTYGGGDGGIRISTGRGYQMSGEGGIVAASVLCVENQGDIQQARFQIGILAHRTDETENVFRGGQFRKRIMQMQALILKMRALCLIRVSRDGRQTGNQMNRLPQHVVQGGIPLLFSSKLYMERMLRAIWFMMLGEGLAMIISLVKVGGNSLSRPRSVA